MKPKIQVKQIHINLFGAFRKKIPFLNSDQILNLLNILVYGICRKSKWMQTNFRGRLSISRSPRFYRSYLLADVSALGSQPPSFCFRKISSWPCVWNYTPGSKQGSLTEKKTAVRQWITVLWPDKCLCEEWMRKLGVCQESHTHTPSLVLFLCTRLNADACELYMWTKSQVEALLLSGRNTCWCRKPTQHKPTKVEDKHPVFTNTLQS